MRDVVKINMEIEVEKSEIELSFGMAIQKDIDEDLTNKERAEIEKLTMEIAKIVSKAVKRGIEGELEECERDPKIDEAFEKTSEKLYEQLSEEDKKKVDNFEKKLKECNTLEDALILAMKALEDEIN